VPEVKNYVNSNEGPQKLAKKAVFLQMFDVVLSQRLFLAKHSAQLDRYKKSVHFRSARQSLMEESTGSILVPHTQPAAI